MAPQNSTSIHEGLDGAITSEAELLDSNASYSTLLPSTKLPENGGDVHGKDEDYADNDIKSILNHSINIQTDEIPIWICGETRFVSGITNKTTCNDIIRALIEDEIRNFDALMGNNPNSLSRDFRDYVITEKWRDIEQALPGDTYILPIWDEWGVAQNEVKLKLKINRTRNVIAHTAGETESKDKKKNPNRGKKINLISKLIQRVIRQGEVIQNQLSNYRENSFTRNRFSMRNRHKAEPPQDENIFTFPQESLLSSMFPMKDDCTDEEILLVLQPPNNSKSNKAHTHLQPSNTTLESSFYQPGNSTLRLSHSKLNRFAKNEFVSSTPNTVNRRRRSLQFNAIRNEIVETTQHIEDLLEYERRLDQHLIRKRKRYREQNDLYRIKSGLEVCVDKVQENLATYGKQIVENELNLYKIKKEIQHKCVVLNNLKRMLDSDDTKVFESFRVNKVGKNATLKEYKSRNLEFVDNIYEFCDNNESIVV